MYAPLHDNKFFLKFFFWDGTYLKLEFVRMDETYSLRKTVRMQNIDLID